jgi:uncharacterized protein (TIGR02301 family)
MLKRLALALLAALVLVESGVGAERRHDKPPVTLPPPSPPATPAPPPETKPYDPQLMRLAEILGALTYLRGLCGAKDAEEWRARMQTLLEAEGNPPVRKERLAGAYNHGLQGYSLTYRTCTANAQVVILRFLAEGERIAKEVESRYHAS